MPIAAQVATGQVSTDGLGYDYKAKIDELLAAAVVAAFTVRKR